MGPSRCGLDIFVQQSFSAYMGEYTSVWSYLLWYTSRVNFVFYSDIFIMLLFGQYSESITFPFSVIMMKSKTIYF